MFKKSSWIVALLLALSLTAFFTSCVDPYVDPDDGNSGEEELTDIPLGDFNYTAGGGASQKGWATDEHTEKESAKGYKTADWQTAKYLVIELKGDEGFKGGFALIWGGEPRAAVEAFGPSNAGWISGQIVADNGTPVAGKGVTLSADKKIARIELSKALTASGAWYSQNVTALKLCLQYYSPDVASLVEKAYFQASSEAVEVEPPPPPPPPFLEDKGAYTVPTTTDLRTFYLDLNEAVNHATSGTNIPEATIDEDKLTFTVSANQQGVFIPFTAAQKAALVAAPDGFTVTIAGTQTGQLRWCIGREGTSGWNPTSMIGPNASSFNTAQTLTVGTGNRNYMDGIVINNNQAVSAAYTIEITSIKVVYKAEQLITGAMAIILDAPVTGAAAKTEVDVKVVSDVVGKGAVTWTPALPADGKFELGTIYAATIAITPAAGLSIASSNLTVNGSAPLYFNPATGTVMTSAFPVTTLVAVTNLAISGINPFTGNTPVTEITNAQYTGAIAWETSTGTAHTGAFVLGASYTAKITLTAVTGYKWDGVGLNTFTVTGATSTTNPVGSGTGTLLVTAVFGPTVDAKINVTVDSTVQKVVPVAQGGKGSVTIKPDQSGYTYTYAQTGNDINYGNGYAYFKVDLGTDTLGDFSKLKVTIKGVSGDSSYKNMLLLASTAVITGYKDNTASQYLLTKASGDIAGTAVAFEFDFSTLSGTNWDAVKDEDGELYFAIIIPSGVSSGTPSAPTVYEFTNIEFVK